MKLILLYTIVLFNTIQLYAQKEDLPEFGQFAGKELTITRCDFDKEANAIVLFDVANSYYNDEYNLVTDRRVRFKILKEKGIEKANIEIPYWSKDDFESISDIHAIAYNHESSGGNVTKELDKKTIFKQKVNERFSILKFAIPDVKVGTIIEYKYESTCKNYGGLQDWYFQSDIPVVYSKFDLTMLPKAEFTYLVHKSPDIPVNIKSNKSAGSVTYEMNNIPGLREEPFMDASRDYLQHVEFQFSGYINSVGSKTKVMTTWKETAQELLDAYYFGKLLDKNLPGAELITAQANTLSTPYNKMAFIYKYVENSFTWNNINSKYADDGIKDAWANKKGTSGEINLILLNLLKKAGLDADPMLVSERDNGLVSTQYPLIDQFNKVVAYMVIDNKKYVLDASVVSPLNIIPYDLLNTNAFIVNPKKPDVILLSDDHIASNFVNVNATVNDKGEIDGYTNINSYAYAKVNRLDDYKENKEKFQHDYFEKNYRQIKIDSFEVANSEPDSLVFQQKFNFSMPETESGDYKLVNSNLFTGLEKNPFTLDNRFTKIDFGCQQKTDVNESFEIPAGMKPEEIPKNVQLVTPDKSIVFMRFSSIDDNVITIQFSLKITQTLYPVEDYPMLKEFYKKMYNILDEQIVLSNK